MADPQPNEQELHCERRIIEAERRSEFGPNAGLLTYRFGLGEIGNTHAGGHGVASITVDEVRRWIATWCTADNAVLTLSGPAPDGLDLALLPSSNEPRDRRKPESLITRPTLVASSKSGVALSVLVPSAWSFWVRGR